MFGVRLVPIDMTCPSFADDTTNVALYKVALNTLLQIANEHSRKWRYDFNTDKSLAMIWGEDTLPNEPLMLGNAEIKL